MPVKDADIYCCKLAKKYGFTMGKGCFGVFAVGTAASVNPNMYIVLMRRDSANKNKELSLLVSVMGCPQERRLFINIYHWFGAKKDFQIFVSMEVHNW